MTALASLHGMFDAVVIGASAGGIEVLSKILPMLPPHMRASVLIVVHMPRERPSMLASLYASRCAVRVVEARDKDELEHGTIYFAPPDYHLLVDRGPSIALSVDDAVLFSRPSIDVLFESAADIYAGRLLGVVLSGANSDGARGLRAIHNEGGTTIVQDPTEAKSSMMPIEALRCCPGAHSLSADRIAELFSTLEVDGSA